MIPKDMCKNHLQLAHTIWASIIKAGDLAIDATCGNGHDTKALIEMGSRVLAYDIQEAAVEATRERAPKAHVQLGCHSQIPLQPVKIVVYNLGYLPGGDKNITTRVESTLESVKRFLEVADHISITCYPGHEEGAREEAAILEMAAALPREWTISHHRWLNRLKAPSLLLLSGSQPPTGTV